MQEVYAIRGDVHARVCLARKQHEIVRNQYTGLFDLGDVEAPFIDTDHWLREGQQPGQSTTDIIVENARRDPEKAHQVLLSTLSGMREILQEVEKIQTAKIPYTAIAGNSREAWNAIASAIDPVYVDQFNDLFNQFHIRTEAGVQYFCGSNGGTAVLYLPWKAPIESVDRSLTEIEATKPPRIVIMSHDYLSDGSIPLDYREGMHPMQNVEQVETTLDRLSRVPGSVEGYFGHIGWKYPGWEVTFNRGGKEIKAHHVDEKGGELLELRL